MVTQKEYNQIKKDSLFWFIVASLLVIAFVMVVFQNIHLRKENEEFRQNNNILDRDKYFEMLNENCGSSFVTYFSGEWTVFANRCISNGYCKYEHIPIEECEDNR